MLTKKEVQVKDTVFEHQKAKFVFLIQEDEEQEGLGSNTHPWYIKTP
jgi:hypothetical protein